ncbi:Cupin domain protein [Palleronia marisminoris]|uniref:Quercetin 2,3-dioxygenase n=1 Tax=Palleronia marisminoris TaxID=315423 RepID=A0A1Y5RV12_9RHOB|nr:cupin domain-containing protein [Palleronia marisminoris]SFG45387.1 Cupin domain protein [Palleronia marisminoris]SLN26032.1 Quercetin 2,3-dioxygenase [Palleronia marisminoris]
MKTSDRKRPNEEIIALPPDGGRRYEMGKLTALFKADEADTAARYSVSEWILAPGQTGVGAHLHEDNDEIFFVLDGLPELLMEREWTEFPAGAFIRIPAGVTHDFRNRSDRPARLLNIFIPGGFERDMPKIVEWFDKNGT